MGSSPFAPVVSGVSLPSPATLPPSLPSPPSSTGWAGAWCENTGTSVWDPGRQPNLLNHVGFTRPRLFARRTVRSATTCLSRFCGGPALGLSVF